MEIQLTTLHSAPSIDNIVNNWEVVLPPTAQPPYVPPVDPQPDAGNYQVFYFTDVHIDMTYLVCTVAPYGPNPVSLANLDIFFQLV